MGNGNSPTPGLRRLAVWPALNNDRARREIAEDIGIGLLTLKRWLCQERDASDPGKAPVDMLAELKPLRKENAALKQERDIKKAAFCSTGQRNGTFEGSSRRLEAKHFLLPRIEP